MILLEYRLCLFQFCFNPCTHNYDFRYNYQYVTSSKKKVDMLLKYDNYNFKIKYYYIYKLKCTYFFEYIIFFFYNFFETKNLF